MTFLLLAFPLLPMLGIALLGWGPFRATNSMRGLSLGIGIVQLAILAYLMIQAGPLDLIGTTGKSTVSATQLYLNLPWLNFPLSTNSAIQIDFFLAIDGLNALMLLLTAFLFPLTILASWQVNFRPRTYFSLLLLLNAALYGVFMALDLFLFFIFYELLLIPLFFLIIIWGGKRKEYAALKFLIYTLVGSIGLLAIIIVLGFSTGIATSSTADFVTHTLNWQYLSNSQFLLPDSPLNVPDYRAIAFWVLLFAFAVKLPVVPFHTWLPDAHVQASTPISMLLAGLLLKVGGYGIIRLGMGIFPDQWMLFNDAISIFAVVSIVYGSFVALGQQDLKRLIAYSSIAHMGYFLLGLASTTTNGLQGAQLQLVNHGIVSALLFFLAGVLYRRTSNYQIAAYGGLWNLMPIFTLFVSIAFAAGMGLPGTNTFVSEFLIFSGAFAGAFQYHHLATYIPFIALSSVFLSAAYYFWTLQRMFFGPVRLEQGEDWRFRLTDLTPLEKWTIIPLVAACLVLGLFPSPALSPIFPAVESLMAKLNAFH
jgi:NADH-quinone oxidoreductase subunit M